MTFFTREIYFPPECWDTTKESLKSSHLMDLLREGKGSGGHSSNVREMRRVWKNVEVIRRTQAAREEKLQELHVSQEVSSKFKKFSQLVSGELLQPLPTPATQGEKVKCGQIPLELDTRRKKRCGGCDDAVPGGSPWMARLIYQSNFDSESNTTFCGGSLISARHVVTAANCVTTRSEQKPVAVDLGEFDVGTEYDCLQTADDCGGNGSEGKACFEEGRCAAKRERYGVKSSLVHPSYKYSGRGSKSEFNVAVLVLDNPVQLTTNIQPICLPPPKSKTEAASRIYTLLGWGNIAKGFDSYKSARILQELRGLVETPLNECRKLVGEVTNLERDHMCVWKRGSGSNGCQGDSGGPVVEQNEGSWDLAGLVSFGIHSACASNTPLVLTRMSTYSILNWIKEVVGEDLPTRQS